MIFKIKRQLLLIFFTSFLASAQEFGANDFRISDMGTDGVTSFFAFDPRTAYSSTEDKYLVVWAADDDRGSIVDNEFEIYGQFITSTGEETGANDFRISFLDVDGNTNFRADEPDIVWNSIDNEFLVVWKGETTIDGENEIFGQRINANTGTLIGSNFRVTDVGIEGNTSTDAARPKVSYSSTSNEYLVVWEADDESLDNEIEIYGQRLSNTGIEIGSNDFRISNQLPLNDANFDARYPSITWNSVDNDFLIVWQGETTVDGESEVYGQLYDLDLATSTGSNFKISDMGTDGDTSFSIGQYTRVDYNSIDEEYLVVWNAANSVANQYEIFGQRISNLGVEVGTNDFQISTLTSLNSNFDAWAPDIIWNQNTNDYLVVYRGDANNTISDEEIYGQRISNLGILNGSSFFLSDMGPESDSNYKADDPAIISNNNGDYLIAWQGDDNITPNDGETEIFIQMYGNPTLNLNSSNSINNIKIYPNPSTDKIYINSNIHDEIEIEIYSVLGKKEMHLKSSTLKPIDISSLSNGLYFISIKTKHSAAIKTFEIIKK